jgi:hypothetical protein
VTSYHESKLDTDVKINRFAKSLRREFGPEIAKDPASFRATVLGKLKPKLPHRRPGRKPSPEIKQAAELYLNLYSAKGQKGLSAALGLWFRFRNEDKLSGQGNIKKVQSILFKRNSR